MKRLLITCYTLCSLSIYNISGQVTNDGQTIALINGVQLTIVGSDVVNKGSLINEGIINFQNDWMNNGAYISETGMVNTTGTDQNINHGTASFNQLNISGGGMKIFRSDLNIISTLSLSNGIVRPFIDFAVNIPSSANITGGSIDSYIQGMLNRSGEGDLHYPIGLADKYLPVTLLEVEANDIVGVIAKDGSATQPLEATLRAISNNHHWRLISNNEFSAQGITVPLLDENFIDIPENTVIAYSNEIDPFASLGATSMESDVSNVSITAQNSIAAGLFTIGHLKLEQTISFDMLPEKGNTDAPFKIFASTSSGLGLTFTSSDQNVATISGDTVTIIYDNAPINHTVTITATQEGNEDYLPAVVAQELFVHWVLGTKDRFSTSVEVYPIPFRSNFNMVLPPEAIGTYQLMIYDASGQLVSHKTLVGSGLHSISDLSQMTEGMYTMRLVGPRNLETFRVFKE